MMRVQEQLERLGVTVVDEATLLKDARERLRQAKEHWENKLYADAYREAQRSLRPMRILTRALWEKATKGVMPVATPYGVSYYTLPKHVQFMQQVKNAKPGPNVLPGGDFEMVPGRPQEAWVPQDMTLDEVEMSARRVAEVKVPPPPAPKGPNPPAKTPTTPQTPAKQVVVTARGAPPDPLVGDVASPGRPNKGGPAKDAKPADPKDPKQPAPLAPGEALPKEGKLCLKLEINPKRPALPPAVLERTFLAINSPAVRLPPGTLVQISAWVSVPWGLTGTADGALLYDSAGGEPLAVRVMGPIPWTRYVLYRRVPASGVINVTLALTGLGAAYFDDVRIEPLTGTSSAPPANGTVTPLAATRVEAPRGQALVPVPVR
jgi:hypothetical protein